MEPLTGELVRQGKVIFSLSLSLSFYIYVYIYIHIYAVLTSLTWVKWEGGKKDSGGK